MLKFSHLGWGYHTCNGSEEQNKQTDLHALNNFSFSIDEVALKKQHVSGTCTFGEEVVHMDANGDAAE